MASTINTMIPTNIIIIDMGMNQQRGKEKEVTIMRNPADHQEVEAENEKLTTEVQSMR